VLSRDIIINYIELLRKGAFLPQALKRISRTLPDVNEVYPTMETRIDTVWISGVANRQKSLNYMVPYEYYRDPHHHHERDIPLYIKEPHAGFSAYKTITLFPRTV
jgi:hypothetical protein